jgi:uncharacterized circularly permuted ATP-grasp superfamily protein
MDAARRSREEKKKELLKQLAELVIEEQVEQGVFLGTPHFSIIERQAMTLGRELSRQAQERGAREVAARCGSLVSCPTCQTSCRVDTTTRPVTSVDGPMELTESIAHCHKCRRSFFPSAS